jgi:hypothetical protein
LSELANLRNLHKDATIWVLGSGSTLGFIKPEFFTDKIVVSTNLSASLAGISAKYCFTHYHSVAKSLLEPNNYVVTLRRDTKSHQDWADSVPNNLVFADQDSYQGPGSSWNPLTSNPPRKDSLAYGSSSLHGAMHLAAWLGASSIILVGADCGRIDGSERIKDYPIGEGENPHGLYNQHHKLMKDWLVQEYGVEVYSLNPFINLNLEGHSWSGV